MVILGLVLLLWLIIVLFLRRGALVRKNGVALMKIRLRALLRILAHNDLGA